MIDKNQAMVDYILTCDYVKEHPLFFNFGEMKTDATQLLTSSNEESYTRRFVDGSSEKNYLFTLLKYKQISYNAIVTNKTNSIENMEYIAEFQTLIDWINEQEDKHNYPNFGDDCSVEEIYCTTINPALIDVNTEVDPPIATYRIIIGVNYIDNSKKLFK